MREFATLDWAEFRSAGDPGIFVGRIPTHGETPVHDHVFHEIVYVESGTAEHLSAEPTRRLRPGDLIVLRPQVWHGYRRPSRLAIINCLFDKRALSRLAPMLAAVDGSFDLFRRPARRPRHEPPVILHARPAHRPPLLQNFERMMVEQRERRNGWQAAISACLLDVLVTTARLSRQQLADVPLHLADRTEQAVIDTASHLEQNFAQAVHLDDLARRVGISPAHLSRSFSRRMGMGAVEFMHRLRCEEACRLLRWTDEPIGQIAIRMGYDEIAYFSRCFRVQIGQSPREYRRVARQRPAALSP